MKIAYLTTNLSPDNGWGRYSYEIIKRMPTHGIDPVILMIRGANSTFIDHAELYADLTSYSDGLLKPLRLCIDWCKIKNAVRQCALIHCFAEPFIPLSYILAGTGQPFIVNAVGTYSISVLKTRWRALYKKAYMEASAILAISNYTALQVAAHLPPVKENLRAIPLGVACDRLDVPLPQAHERENAFLMVGEVKPRKGTLQSVEALAAVVQRFPDAKLYIAGLLTSDIYIHQVKQWIDVHRISDHVIWLGRISDEQLHQYYRRVRGLVMPSMNVGDSFEGFGLVHLEANALGVPAIGSLGCGNEDAIQDGYSGFLIEQGNIRALSEAMMRLLDPAFDWDQLSANALNFAHRMSWDRVVDAYISVYREIEKPT